MLMTKTVIVKWSSNTKKHYEEKGYIYTKMKDEFEVKIEDLPNGSSVKVNVKCDCEECKNPYLKPIIWQEYLKYVKEDGQYYCQKCATEIIAREKMIKTKLKKGKSFEQWCVDNLLKEEADEILSRWDYEKNIDKNGKVIKPSDITYSSKGIDRKGYWFKCLEHAEHKSELKSIDNFIHGRGSLICRQCNSLAQYLLDTYGENAINLYWSSKNTANPWETSKGMHENIWIKCVSCSYHEDYKISASNFVKNKRCPYCTNHHGKVHPLDSLGKLLEDKGLLNIWSDKNNKSPFEYSPKSSQKVWWKCPNDKHEDYLRSISSSNRSEFRCHECARERNESYLQEKVRLYLESLNNELYTILHEKNCTIVPKNPKYKGNKAQLPFDNEIKELKLIIEVHGSQHYQISTWHIQQAKRNNTTPEYELYMQQVRDRYKKFIAYKNGYNYIAIPYWMDNEREEWKRLIDDKLLNINNV